MFIHLIVAQADSCLLRKEFTDLNFMPFRLRLKHHCVTSSRETSQFNMSTCINYRRFRFMETYVYEQLFHFYPLIKTPQKIYQYTTLPSEATHCLTVNVPAEYKKNPIAISSALPHTFQVSMKSCNLAAETDFQSNQAFSIQILNKRHSKFSKQLRGYYDPNANLQPLSIIKITWTWLPPNATHRIAYCLHNANYSSLVLKDCKAVEDSTLIPNNLNNINTFLLERTTTSGVPYKSGLRIGQQPSFATPDNVWGLEHSEFID